MYDFPASPAENQEYTPPVGGQTYIYKAPRWLVKGIPPAGSGGGSGGIDEAPVDTKQYGRQDAAWTEVVANPTWSTLSGKPATFPPTLPIAQSGVTNLVTDLAAKEPSITGGTTSQFWRGDKTWQVPAGGGAGTTISDTAPASPTVGQLWYESDSGNTYIWYADADSSQWVQQSGSPPRDFMFSVPYDLSYGFRSARWAWNDKADFTGSDVMTLSETGNLAVTGVVSVGGALEVTGQITGYGNIRSISGRYIGDESNTLVLSVATGNTAGTVWLRPNGMHNGYGEATLISNGTFSAAAITCGSSGFNCMGVIYGHMAYQCKAGIAGGFGANTFNYNWEASAMRMWVDNTAVGLIAFASDYRIKKDVADLPSTWEAVKALRPVKYTPADFQPPMSDATKAAVLKRAVEDYARSQGVEPDEVNAKDLPKEEPKSPVFQGSDIEHWSLIAHEVQEALIPSAADGVKDMEDGVQSLNQNAIIAALTKALQEAMARIEALEAANGL